MFRLIFSPKTSIELSIRHSRSLSRYSESYLHVHDTANSSPTAVMPSINYCVISILILLFFSDNLMITSSIPLFYHFYQPEYGPIAISTLYSLYGICLMIIQPLTSYLIDRKGPKIPLMYGILFLIFAILFFILAFNFQSQKDHSYGLVILGQCCHGIASPLIQQSGFSLITMSHPYDIRNSIINILTTTSVVGYIFGPLYSALLYSHINSLSVYIPPAIMIMIAFFAYCTVYNSGHSIFINEMTDEDAEIAIGLMPSHHVALSPTHSTSSHQSIASSFYGKQRIDNFYSFLYIFTNKFHFITFLSSLLSTFLLGIFYPLGPNFLHEQFHFNIFQQGLMITLLLLTTSILSPVLSYFIDKTPTSNFNTYSHLAIHSTNQLTSLSQYQAIYIGLLIIGLSLCCIVWIINIYILVLVWLALGVGFAILTIPLMRFFGEIAEWKGYEDFSTASLMYDFSTSLGYTLGPIIAASLQIGLGGGSSGFTRACFIFGIIYALYSMSVLHLRSVGKRLGEDSLELEGSIYGRSLLDGNDPTESLFTSPTLQTNSSITRNIFENSFRENLLFPSTKGLEEDSAVF